MEIAAVFACVRLISVSVSTLPLVLFKSNPDGSTEKDRTHPLYKLLKDAPNPNQTAQQFRQAMTLDVLTEGNGYAHIVRDSGGNVRELWRLDPTKVTVEQLDNRDLRYKFNGKVVPNDEIFHYYVFSQDGIRGLSPLKMARGVIAEAMAIDQNTLAFFENASRPSGILKLPAMNGKETREKFIEAFRERTTGFNAGGVPAIDSSMEYIPINGFNARDAQTVELKKAVQEQIAMIFGVPQHKIGLLDHATFSNIEHQGREFVDSTLMPYFVSWEQCLARALLTGKAMAGYYFKHNVDALLRGDTTARAGFYQQGILSGWMTRNEARKLEELNPIPDGDVPLVPVNMTTFDKLGQNSNANTATA